MIEGILVIVTLDKYLFILNIYKYINNFKKDYLFELNNNII